jgi:hypothetical protein
VPESGSSRNSNSRRILRARCALPLLASLSAHIHRLLPLQASLTCAVTGPSVTFDASRISGSEGKEVFASGKGLNFFKSKARAACRTALRAAAV